MANWNKILSRGSVEDRRGTPGVGSLGLTGVAIIAIVTLLMGGSPTDVLNNLQGVQMQPTTIDTAAFEGTDTYETFVSTVLGSTTDAWSPVFEQAGKSYDAPKLVLFRGSTSSTCGGAQSMVGPHYCPLDETIYLDETFFDELTSRLGAEGGDVAEAYVIAHEVGHHIQQLTGVLDGAGDSNRASVRTELQADCYAGLWAYSLKDKGVFETNEISEAIDAAGAVGDDRIQERTQGYVRPDTFTHGSAAQRTAAFNTGYDSGSVDACDSL